MADPPMHIEFEEPEGDSLLLLAVEGVISEWFGEALGPDRAHDITDCAANVVEPLQGRGTADDDRSVLSASRRSHSAGQEFT